MLILFFLSSGLFLGWSLGANDAANVFGTAVGTRMIGFIRAAVICSVFVILGAVIGGAGASHTLGELGAVNALGGSFVAALAAGLTVFFMTRLSLPVSTSQAIVGAIIGWNLFTGSLTDIESLTWIVITWVLCPILAAIFAVVCHYVLNLLMRSLRIHLLWEDMLTRWLLIAVGAFGSYSLGANNIANVMGVFVPVAPFGSVNLGGVVTISGTQILFLLGGLAIALGVFTYSRRVMDTIGGSLMRLTPRMALIVVLSQSIVLFLFSSQDLEGWLLATGLPTLPLVPVSSSQAVIGAVLGLGLLKRGHGVRFRVMGDIAAGWVATPVIAGVVTFIALFFVQNVFDVAVVRELEYRLDAPVLARLERLEIATEEFGDLQDRHWSTQAELAQYLADTTTLDYAARRSVIAAAKRDRFVVSQEIIDRELVGGSLSDSQVAAVQALAGREFHHGWELLEALAARDDGWRPDADAPALAAKSLRTHQEMVLIVFRGDLLEAARQD